MHDAVVIEHGESRRARRLRGDRLRIALVVAALEGILVLAGAIPWWVVVALALAALVVHLRFGRDHAHPDVRTATWIAAVSQLAVVVVPVLAAAAVVLAAAAVVVLAVVALAALLLDRG